MAIQQGMVTITGFVAAEPDSFSKAGGTDACSFRVGSTRGYRDVKTKEWRRLPTTWVTVKAFRTLAVNVRHSLHKGDAVIVTGVLATDEWKAQDGQRRSRTVLEATNIGHDINYGITELKKVMKANRGGPAQEEMNASDAGATGAADTAGGGVSSAAAMNPYAAPGNGQTVSPVVLEPQTYGTDEAGYAAMNPQDYPQPQTPEEVPAVDAQGANMQESVEVSGFAEAPVDEFADAEFA